MSEGVEHLGSEHQEASFPYRMSAVLDGRGEEWRLVLLYGSEPATARPKASEAEP